MTRTESVELPISMGISKMVSDRELRLSVAGVVHKYLSNDVREFVEDTLAQIAAGNSPLRPAETYTIRVVIEVQKRAPPAWGSTQ